MLNVFVFSTRSARRLCGHEWLCYGSNEQPTIMIIRARFALLSEATTARYGLAVILNNIMYVIHSSPECCWSPRPREDATRRHNCFCRRAAVLSVVGGLAVCSFVCSRFFFFRIFPPRRDLSNGTKWKQSVRVCAAKFPHAAAAVRIRRRVKKY